MIVNIKVQETSYTLFTITRKSGFHILDKELLKILNVFDDSVKLLTAPNSTEGFRLTEADLKGPKVPGAFVGSLAYNYNGAFSRTISRKRGESILSELFDIAYEKYEASIEEEAYNRKDMRVKQVQTSQGKYPILIFPERSPVILDTHLAQITKKKCKHLNHKSIIEKYSENEVIVLTPEEDKKVRDFFYLLARNYTMKAYTFEGAVRRVSGSLKCGENELIVIQELFGKAIEKENHQSKKAQNTTPEPEQKDTKGASLGLLLFEHPKFGKVRTMEIDGKPWFVAMDVARVLDYSATEAMTRRLLDSEKRKIAADNLSCASPQATEDMTLINESGFYRAVLGCTKPEAKEFETWIVRDVLPQIRKTGCYISPELAHIYENPLVVLAVEHVKMQEELVNQAIKLTRNETLAQILQEREAELRVSTEKHIKENEEFHQEISHKVDKVLEYQEKESIATFIRNKKVKPRPNDGERIALGRIASRITRSSGRGEPTKIWSNESKNQKVHIYDIDILEQVFSNYIREKGGQMSMS